MVEIAAATDRVEAFLADRLAASGAEGYVLGVSGGLDSAVAATLAVEAVGAGAVTAWVMPDAPSDPANMRDARALTDALGIERRDVDIAPVTDAVVDRAPVDAGPTAVGNVRARLRMVFEYLDANAADRLVLGATTRSEWLLGYFTKHGDGAVDLRPLVELYKTEVRDVARHLGLDERFLEKAPTAGLEFDQTDEADLGAPYADVDPLLRALVDEDRPGAVAAERADLPLETAERLAAMVTASGHKREPAPTPGLRE
ncbi:MAG: NAD+ synthase [Halobacteriaceae archaeon]